MNKPTLTIASPVMGEAVRIIEQESVCTFYAHIVGTIQGALSAGCTITNLDIVEG